MTPRSLPSAVSCPMLIADSDSDESKPPLIRAHLRIGHCVVRLRPLRNLIPRSLIVTIVMLFNIFCYPEKQTFLDTYLLTNIKIFVIPQRIARIIPPHAIKCIHNKTFRHKQALTALSYRILVPTKVEAKQPSNVGCIAHLYRNSGPGCPQN